MSFYDVDLHAWTTDQASLLRDGRVGEADLAAIAEALDDMSKTARRALRSHLRVLLIHLLKYRFQPDRRSRSWVDTINEQRDQIDEDLAESPSLRRELAAFIDEAYHRALRRAASESQLPESIFPPSCPWTAAQITDFHFFPEA